MAHQALHGTGKTRFRREIIFGELHLSTQIPAPSSANTGRSHERRMAATAGQFRPVVPHKLCGPSPSQMQITERLWGKPAPSSGPQMEAIIGSASQAEQLFSFVEFRLLMQITGQLSV